MTSIPLPERLTIPEARATLARLGPALAAAGEALIDASPLKEMDTAAVAVLLACQRQAKAQGRSLRISGAPPKLVQLAQLYGVAELLSL
jgi:phospholipid transport system transporter-binding protein